MFDRSISVAPFIKSGQLRALALGGNSRLDSLPGVPTLKELGIDVVLMSWAGIFAPTGTPWPVLDTLNAALRIDLIWCTSRLVMGRIANDTQPRQSGDTSI